MISKIQSIVEEYERRYQARLSICYPSLGSTGFQERNQTNNFLVAAEKFVPNLFTWSEFQINGDSRADNHLDAIAVDFQDKEIWLIESKRIQSQRKFNAISADKERMVALSQDPKTIFERFYDHPNIPFEEFKIYGLILADVWNYEGQHDARMEAYKHYRELAQNKSEQRACHIIEIPIKGHRDWQYRLIVDIEQLRAPQ